MDRRKFLSVTSASIAAASILRPSAAEGKESKTHDTLLRFNEGQRGNNPFRGQSLAGDWRFEIAAGDTPVYARELPERIKIRLPGTMDDAGLGPKNTNPPDLQGPYRLYDYAGPAWYQRDIEVPKVWQGKRVTLFLERCRWVTRVWLDDRYIGTHDSLIAPHVYDFGTGVMPGKHRLTICVDNTVKFSLGKFVSVLYGGTPGNMNGIIGRIELEATPPVWIDDVQVYPDVDKSLTRVVVKIGNATGQPGRGVLHVGTKSVEATWDKDGGSTEVNVDMSNAKLWDEFSPNLQQLRVRLGGDKRTVYFGMRKFAVRGTQFTMNGRPLFLRGTVECSTWPLTGYPPTDVPAWQRIYRVIKSYGMNHIRFHSWCPPEAGFTAADLEGIIIHVEGPQANIRDGTEPARAAFSEAELKRIVDTYGNHPSFCLMAIGNECRGINKVMADWVDMLIHRDPRHLYSSSAGGMMTVNRQWTETAAGRGIHGPGTESDLRNAVAQDHLTVQRGGFSEDDLRHSALWEKPVPILGHEIGQWTFFPDFNEMKKYTGVMRLKNFEIVREDLAKKGLLDLAPQYVQACGKLAVRLYKEEVEQLLRTRGYGGFTLLALNDYPMQGTALVGPLDEFWESKGFITPEAFRRFCGPTVPLLRMPKCTYTTDEWFTATVDVAHYGPAGLPNAQMVWAIKDKRGQGIASGKLPVMKVPARELTSVGDFRVSLAKVHAPSKLTVTVSLKEFSNDWDIWVYPQSSVANPPEKVVVLRKWEDAAAALGDGKTVVLFPENPEGSLPGKFLPVFWSPVWFPRQQPNTMSILCEPQHPAFAQFPTDSCSDWQWWDLLNHSRSVILDDTPSDFRPLVQVIDNFARNHKLANLFEARVAAGKLLVCSIDLLGLAGASPAANQLLRSLYAYVGSQAFQPTQTLGETLLGKLLA
jgi:Glycosyl hydrolases family 2, sugar binding domain/Glycosyl hydrolases family 2